MPSFNQIASDVEKTLEGLSISSVTDGNEKSAKSTETPKVSTVEKSKFARLASTVHVALGGAAPPDERDPEWQRVNSSIADVLKDTGVLFSKLARLQGDFAGIERAKLEEIGNKVRDLTDELSKFSSDFYNGELNMRTSETPFNYGGPAQGGGNQGGGGAPPPAPPTPAPAPPAEGGESEAPKSHSEEEFDVEAEISEEDAKLDEEFDKDSEDEE